MKLGVVGFAHGHVDMYIQEIAKMDDADVICGWDHDPQRALRQCQAHGIECCLDLDDLLNKEGLNGVIVASETSLHEDLVVKSAQAGKDILLQKPMALSLEACDRMIEALRDAGVRFSMAWQMRCDPQNVWMRDSIHAGLIGEVVMLRRRHGLSTHLWPDFTNLWHVKPELNRGMWMDDAAHPVDLLLWFFGKPKSVMAEIDTLFDPRVKDDNGAAIFRFEKGVIGIVESSFTCVAAEDTTTIMGVGGTILQSYGDAPSCGTMSMPSDVKGLKYCQTGDKEWTVVDIPTPAGHGERIRGVARPAVEFFLGERDPIATPEEGRLNVAMLLACYESSSTGQRVTFTHSDRIP